MKIQEKKFRGSQICRVLSYPISYAIAKMLLESGPLGLDDLVKEVKRTKSTVCNHMAKMRLANIVRYEKENRQTKYWIKYPYEMTEFMKACESLVERTTQRLRDDF